MQAATFLCGQFPNTQKADEIFLRALAALLQSYGPEIVRDCISPVVGIVRDNVEFLALNKVAGWCDRRQQFYRNLAGPTGRLQSRPLCSDVPPRTAGQYSYEEFLQWAAANGSPVRPIGRFDRA